MKALLFVCVFSAIVNAAPSTVRSSEGTVTVPTYEHEGREMEPPLFASSIVAGMYPFTTYLPAFKPGPKPQSYHAIFLENEYLKLTYIPDFGDRIFSVYDKLRHREMLYRNDVIKPAPYNPRNSWPQSGMELTGPHDLHTLTLHGEPFWANKVIHQNDGSVTLALGETDPVYGMEVTLSATLHPGIAALEIAVFCFNPHDDRKPQMFWINTAINATPKTRFIYPMSRTVGHTTAEIADWPIYNGIDYSWDRNNKHMLGVFGIDIYDNFQGAYQFDRDYGIFRFADRRIVQGMKLWTFGYGEEAQNYENGYTDHAGPYVELQSGRHVWDGHYEWVAPHKTEGWSEWWIPVAGTDGLTTLTRDVALKLQVTPDSQHATSSVQLTLAATRVFHGATISIDSKRGNLLRRTVDLNPATPLHIETSDVSAEADALTQMTVSVTDATGHSVLDYHRPDSNPGRKEYTPFTRPLEGARKSPDQMSIEELTLAAEYQLKELDEAGANRLLTRALQLDPGYSKAHLLLGITAFTDGRYEEAIVHLQKAIERDAYSDTAYSYLAMSQFALGLDAAGERSLYFIWPDSAYYGEREFHLGRLAFLRKEDAAALSHLHTAVERNGSDVSARLLLAIVLRDCGQNAAALDQLKAIEAIDPTYRGAAAERWLLTGNEPSRVELLRLTGGQTQEAISLASTYRSLHRWKEAAIILKLIGDNNHDPWGTTPEFYYTLAYCQQQAGDTSAAATSRAQARAATGKVDRFPYRQETEAPLAAAVQLDPNDTTARFALACLLYFRNQPKEAIREWEAVVKLDPGNFSAHRALGLAYAEHGFSFDQSVAELERAIELNPAHVSTLNDLSALYARAGRFDEQLALLEKALQRSPTDDDLAESVLAANLSMGRYNEAQHLIETHRFATRHRSYTLRDKFRQFRTGMGAQAFQGSHYEAALQEFQSALHPPASLGVDTFENQSSPQLSYYIGRTYEAMGRQDEARLAYQECLNGLEQLSGDRDSWNSDNFFMVLALDRLHRSAEAKQLSSHFENFAATERESKNPDHRAAALYLLALVSGYENQPEQARRLLTQALEARPDLIPARLAMRGDSLGPISTKRN